jgi:hypothetical protein
MADYLTLRELEALGYTLPDLPPTELVGLDGAPCWERAALEQPLGSDGDSDPPLGTDLTSI